MSEHDEYLRDARRVAALRRSEGEPAAYDRWARVAARALGAPVSLVSLVGADHSTLAGKWAVADPLGGARVVPIADSLCACVVADGAPLVVDDARTTERLKEHRAVRELGVVSYLGVPLRAAGHVLGALCVIDGEPRVWSVAELDLLGGLAAAVAGEMERALGDGAEAPRLGAAAWDAGTLERVSARLQALGDPTRLRILRTLGDGERTVGEVATAAGIAQPSATKHLQLLLVHGLVARRRDGGRTFYRVVDHATLRLCDTMLGWVAADDAAPH